MSTKICACGAVLLSFRFKYFFKYEKSITHKIWSLQKKLVTSTKLKKTLGGGQGQKLKMSILKVYLYTKQYYELSMRYITSNVAICVHNYRV